MASYDFNYLGGLLFSVGKLFNGRIAKTYRRGHSVNLVIIAGEPYLVDVGYGGMYSLIKITLAYLLT